jgi:hypothetical protein
MTTFYVLGVEGKPWVLQLEGFPSLNEARRAVNWQCVGQGRRSEWAICTRTGPDTFQDETGKALTVHRGIYTEEAWERFLRACGMGE